MITNIITVEQCQALLKIIDTSTQMGLRDKAIISLMMTAGLRTIEVVRADVGDLHFRHTAATQSISKLVKAKLRVINL